MNSHQFLYLVKNLRAVAFLDSSIDAEENLALLKWLGVRYRNRRVGFCGVLNVNSFPIDIRKRLARPPFVPLFVPNEIMEMGSNFRLMEDNLWQQMLAAAFYVSPLVGVLSNNTLVENHPACIWSSGALGVADDRDRKFNIRLGDYAMTDFLQDLLPATLNRIANLPADDQKRTLLAERLQRAVEDGRKRYWRLFESSAATEGESEENIAIYYLDPLKFLLESVDLEQWQAWLQNYPCFFTQYGHLFNLVVMVLLKF